MPLLSIFDLDFFLRGSVLESFFLKSKRLANWRKFQSVGKGHIQTELHESKTSRIETFSKTNKSPTKYRPQKANNYVIFALSSAYVL